MYLEENSLISLNGNIFNMETTLPCYASTKQKGYIILPDGNLVVVPYNRSHGDVFSEYLTNYLGLKTKLKLNGVQASTVLAQYNCITYMSTSLEQRTSKFNKGYGDSGYLNSCKGIFSLINDMENITLEQIDVLLELINGNYSITGVERVELSFGIISYALDINKEEILKFLKARKEELSFTK